METIVPSITAVVDHSPDTPIQWTIVPDRPIQGTHSPISPEECAVRLDMSDEDRLQNVVVERLWEWLTRPRTVR